MTDTAKPNGDRDRPSDREAAKNPRRPAMGPPQGTASSRSTSPPIDMALQRELSAVVRRCPRVGGHGTASHPD